MKTDTIILPAYWATALINGDWRGLDTAEAARCRKIEHELHLDGWNIVDVGEEFFTWSYKLYDAGANCSGGTVAEYTILRN